MHCHADEDLIVAGHTYWKALALAEEARANRLREQLNAARQEITLLKADLRGLERLWAKEVAANRTTG